MSKPHKHADVIKAWADGKEVEFRSTGSNKWESLLGHDPMWSVYTEYRVKPEPHKWQKEIDAFARGETIQYRDSDPAVQFAFNCKDWIDFDSKTVQCPMWSTTATREYRIKPKTVKTRLRVAAFGHPNGEGIVWLQRASTDAEAAEMEGHSYFLCWLHDWKEIERPVPEPSVVMRDLESALAKGFDGPSWIGFDFARGDSRASIGVFYNYCKAGKPSPTKDQAK